MTAPRIGMRLVALGVTVVAVVALASSGLLSARATIMLDGGAQLVAGALAAFCCGWMSRRVCGVERTWRRLMAVGMASWVGGRTMWLWQRLAEPVSSSPSWADVGDLMMPVFALMALLIIGVPAARRQPDAVPSRPVLGSRLVLILDGLVVVGSLLVVTWATALGAVAQVGAPTPLAFLVAIAHPVFDLVLVVIVVLVLTLRPIAGRLRAQLALLGLGLVGVAASDSAYAYVVASGGGGGLSPLGNAGLIAGPGLVAVAALVTGESAGTRQRRLAGRTVEWAHLLPYTPLGALGLLLVAQQITGERPDAFETYLGIAIVALIVVRQMTTLIDNRELLAHVVDAQRRLHYQAFHDPLTGLANRALFRNRLAAVVELCRAQQRPAALLFIDLDDFKVVNDTFGHSGGDRVLRTVGERLRACVRGMDTVARLGGDEFAVLIDAPVEQVERLGHRILAQVCSPYEQGGETVSVAASVGAVVIDGTEPGLTPDTLIRRADAAMYAGKRSGKGVLVVYGPEHSDGDEHLDLPARLAEALIADPAASGLDVHYQPIVRMVDGEVVSYEALARWVHPELGPVSASTFVAVAERCGLIGRLDEFVLDRSCRDLAAHLAVHGGHMSVHVNVAGSRFGHPDVEASAIAALERYGLQPHNLVLEVTESSRIPDPVAAAESAGRLRERGIKLALDDFGTGYNTLSQLHALPVDIVKLDRTLTAVRPVNPTHSPLLDASDDATRGGRPPRSRPEALCRAIVTIAAELGVSVVAEGVEGVEQAAVLTQVGCDYAQGYLYGRPAPLTTLVG